MWDVVALLDRGAPLADAKVVAVRKQASERCIEMPPTARCTADGPHPASRPAARREPLIRMGKRHSGTVLRGHRPEACKVGVTGHQLNYLWPRSASGAWKRGFWFHRETHGLEIRATLLLDLSHVAPVPILATNANLNVVERRTMLNDYVVHSPTSVPHLSTLDPSTLARIRMMRHARLTVTYVFGTA